MKRSSKLFAATLLGVAWSGSLFATIANYNFDVDPSTDPNLSGAFQVGNHNYLNANGFSQLWCSGAAGAPVDGFSGAPGDGYLSISDGTNGNNGLAFVFPDIDNGLPLNGFQIEMDLRVGNGNSGRPADGFSISFARAGDQALVNATNSILNGFAGGDSLAAAASSSGSIDVENGTKTGVAVVFDAWQGNFLPDTTPYSSPPAPPPGIGAIASNANTDREGIAVRLDDVTLTQIDLIYNRNIKDCVPSQQTSLTNNATGLSMQTGTNAIVLSGTQCSRVYGAIDASGSYVNLSWQHLLIRLTNNPPPTPCTPPSYNLLVTWKGVTCVNTNLASFSPYAGRLILAGRTGGSDQNCHVDRIKLNTVPANGVVLAGIHGLLNGFTFTLADNPPNTFVGIVQVLLDATNNVTGSTTVNYAAPTTTGLYQQATKFAPGSTHQAQVCWRDNNNNTNSTALSFTVPQWIQMPTNQALPLSAIDTTKPGLRALTAEVLQNNPNQAWWTDQMLEGRRGPNIQGASSLPTESDGSATYKVWDGPVDFINGGGNAPQHGFFNGVASGDNDLNLFGLGLSGLYPQTGGFDLYQQSAIEFFGYVYFPTSGVYNMVMGSDDGFQLSVSQNPLDRMGQVLWFLNGSRVPTSASPPGFNDIRPVVVDAPGAYPIRLMWENGGGAAALEWYTTPDALHAALANINSFLVNDTNQPSGGAILLYRAANGSVPLGPYVKDADPVRGDPDVVFYQPIMVTLNDGQGSKTINDSTVALTVDGAALAVTPTRSGSTLKLTQTGTPNWSGGPHTNIISFADNLANNYRYTNIFTVLGGASGVARADTTNAAGGFVSIPASFAVSLGSVDTSQPGWRIRSWQTPQENCGHCSFYEEQIQGMHGANLADQTSATSGYFVWGDSGHPFGGPGALVLRHSFNDNGTINNYSGGKVSYAIYNNPVDYSQFGIGAVSVNPYPGNLRLIGNHKAENSSMEITTWLYFPNPGTYIMHFNTDDGVKVCVPYGSLNNKLGLVVFEDNVGRGLANGGGVETGGSYAKVVIPATGAYPFRVLYFNSGGDAGVEWAIFQQLADGTVKPVQVNDSNIPGSIKAYQTLTAGNVYGPYVSYANPVFDSQQMMSWQNIVVDLTDGPGLKTVNTVSLTVDGTTRIPTITHPSAGITHVVLSGNTWLQGGHTNILTFTDNNGGSYSNWWTFAVPTQTFPANPVNMPLLPSYAIQVPLSNRVDVSQVDTSKPGFRVRSAQIVAPPTGPNNTAWTEEVFEGLRGANIAIQSGSNGGAYSYSGPVDFADNINYNNVGNGGFASSGEYRYNLAMSNTFGIVLNNTAADGAGGEQNACLMFGGWIVFPQAGYYCMTVNSDDGFKVTSPYGRNALSQAGTVLGYNSTGRGNNTGYNPNPFALGGSVSPCLFNIPAAGAYPIRMIYENGGGGINVEWVMYQYFTNSDVARVIVGATNDPGAYPIYQTLLVDDPYVSGFFPSLGGSNTFQPPSANAQGAFSGANGNNVVNFGFGGADLYLLPGTGGTNFLGQTEDLTIQLTDGSNRTVNTNTIALTFLGVTQPVEISTNGNGITTIIRRANTTPYWQSGSFGPLVLSYQDSNGQLLSQSWSLVTAFWGTLSNSYNLSQIDTSKPGFAYRINMADAGISPGGVTMPTRIHWAEQVLQGLLGPNKANQTNLNDGQYWDIIGTGTSNGVTRDGLINFNINGQGQAGDFQSGNGFVEKILPGTPGNVIPTTTAANSNNNFACEFLSYIEFPTNGTYILGVASDDGFRVTRGLNPPTNNGSLIVNSPSPGRVPAVQSTFLTSTFLTSPLTGNLFFPNGISFQQGSTTNGEGCVITDPFGSTSGKILIMYRSAFCSFEQQVANAVAAGAIGVIFVQNRTNTDGQFPQEPGVFPNKQPIPAIEIRQSDGAALIAALANNTVTVNVTMTVMDNIINPPPGVGGPLGQADIGKGSSDMLFPVVVQQSGVYPIRLVYFQGGGGGNVEFFSVTGTNRVLINDLTSTNGPGPSGTGLRAFFPTMNLTITVVGPNAVITFGGKLQSAPSVTGPWSDVVAATSSPFTTPASQLAQFYRAVLLN